MPASKKERAEYERLRYHRRRTAIKKLLGGKCASCGTKKSLEIDHVHPEKKSFNLGRLWSYAWETVLAEAKKCQLLCSACHKKKHGPKRHGWSLWKKGCRCEVCVTTVRAYWEKFNPIRNAKRRRVPLVKTGCATPR